MTSLILEGGTLRPIFSAGVMDALLEQDIMFPYCIGVSAGISNGFSYISKQKRRNLDIVERYRNDNRYIGYRNFLRCHSLFGLDFIFGEIPNRLIPFDADTFHEYKGKLLIGVTNAITGESEYMDGMEVDTNWTMLRATCAIPLFVPAIEINGNKYYDGGLCDPIPVRKAIDDGNEKHLIILTQPKGYMKQPSKQNEVVGRIFRNRYPKLESILQSRHERYNETVYYCEQLEQEGRAIIIRPEYPLNSFEKDIQQLKINFQHGYDLARDRMSDILKLVAQ